MEFLRVVMRFLPMTMLLCAAAPAAADAPLAPAATRLCSLNAQACVMRAKDGRTATVWRAGRNGARLASWQANIRSPRLDVGDDGRSLVELYPGLNLLDADAGPDTVVLTFHRPASAPVRIRLRDVVANMTRLPATSSHRQWARAYGYDGRGSFLLETAEGRRLRFDPATGRLR